jgi:hypothetical protein
MLISSDITRDTVFENICPSRKINRFLSSVRKESRNSPAAVNARITNTVSKIFNTYQTPVYYPRGTCWILIGKTCNQSSSQDIHLNKLTRDLLVTNLLSNLTFNTPYDLATIECRVDLLDAKNSSLYSKTLVFEFNRPKNRQRPDLPIEFS